MEAVPIPLNREWRDDAEGILAESPIDEEAVQSVEERIHRLQAEIDTVWDTPAWRHIDAMLAEEFARESQIIMATDEVDKLMAARERARFLARLRKKPEEVLSQLQELSRERRLLLGEEDAPEE